jgi:hypothetical protein
VGGFCEVYYPPGSGGCTCQPDGCWRLGRYNSSCNCSSLGGFLC